jgi:hypothetical protein
MAYFKSQGLVPGCIFVLRRLVVVLDASSALFVHKRSDIRDCDSAIGLLWVLGEEELV